MKLVRPHIPLRVRVDVAARQMHERGLLHALLIVEAGIADQNGKLHCMLEVLFGKNVTVHLDHDPPLCLRHIVDADKGIYDPSANDPRYLVYRTAEEHRVKTFIRGEGAQLSDAGKRRKEIRRLRPKWPSRWPPKGSRPLQWWKPR